MRVGFDTTIGINDWDVHVIAECTPPSPVMYSGGRAIAPAADGETELQSVIDEHGEDILAQLSTAEMIQLQTEAAEHAAEVSRD